MAKGLNFHRYSEARQLARDGTGRVIGVKILSIPAGSSAAAKFGSFIKTADRLLAMLPPTLPFAAITIGLGSWYLRRAAKIEAAHRQERWIRAKEGVLLSTGGFIMNNTMVRHFAPTYATGMPNGTLGDQGQGIMMGAGAGGQLALMDKISAWRFINPPKAWSDAIVVNSKGKRMIDETVYGASLGEQIGDHNGGVGYIIYDKNLRKQAFKQALDPLIVPFQRDITLLNLLFNYKKADSIDELAHRSGIDPLGLIDTVAAYNRGARGEQPDAFGKQMDDMVPIVAPPFYAMDISINSRFLPLPVITFGGLRIDERSGLVLDEAGQTIPGLYAAGRTAVGVASNTYVSGLSFADCVFSGRRVARHIARANR
jgi:3-oxo-5alpha-steroid 4-dehydrogenase